MLINRSNFSLHSFWFSVFVVGTLAAICGLVNFEQRTIQSPGGSSMAGLLCGTVGAVLMVFECLLWPRKRLLRRWRIGRVRTWMCAHIWLGLLTLPLVLVHAGVAWRGGLGATLMILYSVVMASGLFGLLMQQLIPRWMLNAVPDETIYSQIEVVVAQNLTEADALLAAVCGAPVSESSEEKLSHHPEDASGAPDSRMIVGSMRSATMLQSADWLPDLPPEPIANTEVLQHAYRATIRPYLLHEGGRSSLRDERQSRLFFADVRSRTSPAAGFAIDRFEQWCGQRRQFAKQARLHFWLYSWLAIHLPLSIALLVLVAWHAVVALKYSGVFSFT